MNSGQEGRFEAVYVQSTQFRGVAVIVDIIKSYGGVKSKGGTIFVKNKEGGLHNILR
jgi:hypothetical protein